MSTPLTDKQARKLAEHLLPYQGRNPHLLAFARTGEIQHGLADFCRREREANRREHGGANADAWDRLCYSTGESEWGALLGYIAAKGVRGPQPNWTPRPKGGAA